MLTVAGLWFQLAMVRERARRFACGELTDGRPTAILSLNQMSSVYLACFAFFFYGLSLTPVNHYLAWPRFMAVLLVIAILHYMAADRRTLIVRSVYGLTIALAILNAAILLYEFWFVTIVLVVVGLVVLMIRDNLREVFGG